MALENVTLTRLDNQFSKFYKEFLETECEDRKKLVLDNSKRLLNFDANFISFPQLSLNEKILLGVLQWYMPLELRVLINLWLEEHWGGEFREIQRLLCTSKYIALGYILVNKRWSARDFYGNILKEKNLKKIKFLKVGQVKKKAKRIQRHRGYRDKGSLRLPHQSIGFNFRKLKTVIEKEEEEILKEQIYQDLLFEVLEEIYREMEENLIPRTLIIF